GIAHASDVIDVPVDPLQYRHDLRDTIAGARELTMREPHEFVGRAKAAGQQKRYDLAREVRPHVLQTGLRKQLSELVLDDGCIPDGHVARQGSPYAPITVRGGVGKKLGRGL